MTARYWFPKHYADEAQRLRVPLGFVMIAALAWLATPTRSSLAAGLPISMAGLSIRAWAAGHLAKNESLAMSGPYSYVRNPLYLGTLLAALGFVVASRAPWLGISLTAIFLLVYIPAIELEEQHLRKLFPEYEQYARRVPLLIPRGRRVDVAGGFHFRLYRRNEEYQALAGWLAGVALLCWKAGMLPWAAWP